MDAKAQLEAPYSGNGLKTYKLNIEPIELFDQHDVDHVNFA